MSDVALVATANPYNERVIRQFTVATLFWGVVAFLVGVVIALQLAFPVFNFGLEWTTFGRLRPVHTSAAIFAFGGSALLATRCLSLTICWNSPKMVVVIAGIRAGFAFVLKAMSVTLSGATLGSAARNTAIH